MCVAAAESHYCFSVLLKTHIQQVNRSGISNYYFCVYIISCLKAASSEFLLHTTIFINYFFPRLLLRSSVYRRRPSVILASFRQYLRLQSTYIIYIYIKVNQL